PRMLSAGSGAGISPCSCRTPAGRAPRQVAQRMRKAIAGMPFEPAGEPYRVTASFGVSTVDIVTRDVSALLANAQAALRQAKAEGRNRVVGWQGKSIEGRVRRRVLKAGIIHFGDLASA